MNPEGKRELLRTMLRIRRLETAWAEAYFQEEIGGIPPALSTGQEAVSAGAADSLTYTSMISTYKRRGKSGDAMAIFERAEREGLADSVMASVLHG